MINHRCSSTRVTEVDPCPLPTLYGFRRYTARDTRLGAAIFHLSRPRWRTVVRRPSRYLLFALLRLDLSAVDGHDGDAFFISRRNDGVR